MRNRLFQLAGAVLLGLLTLVSLPASAHATLLDNNKLYFDVLNHPDGKYGNNVNKADVKDYVLLLTMPSGQVNTFRSVDVQMVVDTNTGYSQMFGNVIHLQSGDPWRLDITLNDMHSRGPWDGSGQHVPFPYADMFKDLKAAGCSNTACTTRTNEIYWDLLGQGVKSGLPADMTMKLTYTGTGTPTYDGPKRWIDQGDRSLGEGGFLTYRHRLDQNIFANSTKCGPTPNPYYYDPQFGCVDARELFGGDFFWAPKNATWWNRGLNSLFLIKPQQAPPPTIPEPTTGLLFGLGALGARLSTRRRRSSR